jgi:uncharacterized membrane protein
MTRRRIDTKALLKHLSRTKKLWPGKASALRYLAIAAILAAALIPPVQLESDRTSVIYVVDRSQSMSPADLALADAYLRQAAEARGEAALGVVAFDARPTLVVSPGEPFPVDGGLAWPEEGGRGSDLASAVRLAGAALPQGGRRRIVVLGDGRATRGDALDEVQRLREQGVTVDTVPLGSNARDETTVAAVQAVEPRVSEGEPVTVHANLRGEPGAEVQAGWARDGLQVSTEVVTLDEDGQGTATYTDPSPGVGRHIYEARVFSDLGAATDLGRTLAVVSGRPRVLMLSSTGERPSLLIDALEHAGAQVEVRSLEQGDPSARDLEEVDLVVLADVSLARRGEVTLLAGLTEDGQSTLVDYVSERGGGLLVLGGLFGMGPEYSGQPLTRVLPVEIEDMGEIEDPSVAMAIMLDRSGSMGAWVGGGSTKLQLAIEAALAAAGTLRPFDRVGIASVDEITTWYAPIGHIGNVMVRRENIRAMRAGGGGIYVYTALADAYTALRTAPEPIRHVVLFSDTADSEEQWQGCPFDPCSGSLPYAVALARDAAAAGITTSVVGIGAAHDRDTQFLRNLAAAGGGRFYLTSTGTDLRRIFVSETRAAARSSLREEHIELQPGDPHQILEGLDVASMPAIEGFVQTGRRTTADTALLTPDGRPILASWRYGLGSVVAWTTDAGTRWTIDWAQWEGAGQLMRQMVRFAMRRHGGNGTETRVALRDQGVELDIQAPEGAELRAPARVELTALSDQGYATDVPVTLERTAPGRWIAHGRTTGQPFVVARVYDEEGALISESLGTLDAETENAQVGPDDRALRELATVGAGLYAPEPTRTLRADGPRGTEPTPVWPWLFLLAATLVAIDLWLRRLGQGKRQALSQLLATPTPKDQLKPEADDKVAEAA